MKKLVKVEEVEGEGLVGLMGEQVMFFCLNYIYAGKLVGVNNTCIKVENPVVVYETGEFSSTKFKDAQALPHELYIQTDSIESFGRTNKK